MKPIFKRYFKIVGLIWAGCLVLSFFVYMSVLAPQRKTKKRVEKQLAEIKQIYESAMRAGQEKTKIQLREQIDRLENRLRDFIIDFEDSANLTFDISQIATEKKVGSFNIKDKAKRRNSELRDCEYIGENYINISFTADFIQFATFLNRLERHRPVIFVDKFAIARSDLDDSGHKVDMELAVFVRKRQES